MPYDVIRTELFQTQHTFLYCLYSSICFARVGEHHMDFRLQRIVRLLCWRNSCPHYIMIYTHPKIVTVDLCPTGLPRALSSRPVSSTSCYYTLQLSPRDIRYVGYIVKKIPSYSGRINDGYKTSLLSAKVGSQMRTWCFLFVLNSV